MARTIYSTVLGAIVAVHLVTAAGAQFADPPQTYSVSAIGSMTGSSMTIKVVVWYRFLAGAVYKNGPAEGTVRFSAAGTKTVTLEGTIRVTPAVGQTSLIAAMEDEQGNHGPQTVTSGPVNYNRTCQK